jgi:SAM-dependent methyltransferase
VDLESKKSVTRGFWYLPTRPATIRRVLREAKISDYDQTEFVDFGSGKGRVVLLAAEYPFKKVTGVELSRSLHETAQANLQSCVRSRRLCCEVECLNIDALDYEFPDANLVLYFFNPFGEEILQPLLIKLRGSIAKNRRNAVILMVRSEFDGLIDSLPDFKLVDRSRTRSIYTIDGKTLS